ncbi:MAG: translocation/assembly module TamB domain-containing protein [Acidobacteriia bacterium]|nr:translocation/assembly module TamB domain-containing protein [Terriglobia bacterium]
MTRKRLAVTAAGAGATVLLLAGAAGMLVLRSDWLHEKVREALIDTVEKATGGRAEIGSFDVSWIRMRVEVRQFTLHGREPAGKPPLVEAASVTVGLKLTSWLGRDVHIESLDAQDPRVYLMVNPDGSTNLPEPPIKRHAERNPIETLLELAIGRFSLQNGVLEVEGRGRTPFEAQGRNLEAKFLYELARSRYQGDLSIQPLDVQWGKGKAVPVGVRLAATMEKNRIGVSSGRLTTGDSTLDFSGSVEDLVSLRGAFGYRAHVTAADANRILQVRGPERGTADLTGTAEWAGASNYSLAGNLRVAGVEFKRAPVQVFNAGMQGALRVTAGGAGLTGVRISGEGAGTGSRVPVEGNIAAITLRGRELDIRGVSLRALGGAFAGEARVEGYDRYQVQGEITGLDARRAVAVYSREPLPWDSRVAGAVELEGSLRMSNQARASVQLTLGPAPDSPPVGGEVAAVYNAADGSLDFARSYLSLPASRVEITGALGRQLRVHLETRNLNDFLPVFGSSAVSARLSFQGGSAQFNGTVTGPLGNPAIVGRLQATRFAYAGESFDSLEAAVTASPREARIENATLVRGITRGQFQLDAGLRDWKPDDGGRLSGSGTVRNAAVSELLALVKATSLPATGTVNVSGQVSGTIGDPQFTGEVEAVKGSLRGEPFDRFTARLAGSAFRWQMSAGRLTAGAKEVRMEGSFEHEPNRLDAGRVHFQVESNALPLAEIRTLAQVRPGIRGTLQIAASGAIDLLPAGNGRAERVRLAELQADVAARNLQLAGRSVGDAHLTASSQGTVLKTHLEANFADSAMRGDGEWRLENEYPGNATLTFTRLDLAALKDWIAPSSTSAFSRVTGFADGEVHLKGPILDPARLTADARVPTLEVRLASDSSSFTLRNAGPIVASMENSVVTVDSAKLVGRSTELAVTGKVSLPQRNPLDLRVNGRIDLAILASFNSEIESSGSLMADATIRGPLSDPQLNGRLSLADASISYAVLPNGISNANGVILFTGDRATIQSLTADTGGGKIQLSGFAGYNGGPAVFRLRAEAQGVRVRYPEGISTVADATLDLTGTAERSMLAGTITIRRTSFNLQSDFNSLLAKSEEPVRTPAARAGFLGGLNYDVQIQTAPDIQFESALTQGLQAGANLRLRGTATNPALLGRINVTQGQLLFFGTKYNISQGSISFFNPVKIDPVLNVDLETKARGIDITLTVSGPVNKLNLSPRSDPPLQFNEIVSVLTTGQNPTTDTGARVGQQSATQQPFQQSAASALLGQVIASPVSGRLQRFFGISKLRIDPTLPGVEYNPQARLTLEQQVTPEITFTYITNVTSANPQVVSVEWSVSKQWSVVAQREENGLLGLDFFFKKRFK